MKILKIIMATALSLLTMQSFAQTPLESMRRMFSEYAVTIDCRYETELQNVPVTAEFSLVVQGEKYRLSGNGLEVYCNGKTVWTVDESSCEVVIEPCSGPDRDYLANPVLLLIELETLFNVTSPKRIDAGRVEYVLNASAECGVTNATVVLTSDGMIVSGEFSLEDGSILDVDVLSMKKTEEKPASFFSPDRKFTSDWIVTDLR